MFSTWSTVEMICRRKEMSAISRLLREMRIKRLFCDTPNPWRRCWVMVARKLELRIGLKVLKALLVVMRLLLKPTESAVPVRKPLLKEKLPKLVFWFRVDTPERMVLDWGDFARSSCSVPLIEGSSGSTAGPAPVVELTMPALPAPAPPAPAEVPPAPPP